MIYESNEGKKLCKRNHESLIIIGQKGGDGAECYCSMPQKPLEEINTEKLVFPLFSHIHLCDGGS